MDKHVIIARSLAKKTEALSGVVDSKLRILGQKFWTCSIFVNAEM